MGLQKKPEAVAAYEFSLSGAANAVKDFRQASDKQATGKLKRIAEHAGKMRQAQQGNLEDVVRKVHADIGNADAALYNQPPRAAIRQTMRGEHNPQGLPPEFIIIRNAQITLTRIGLWQPGKKR